MACEGAVMLLSEGIACLGRNSKSYIKSSAYRRFQSMPIPFCGFDDISPATVHTTSRLSWEVQDRSDSPPKISKPILCFDDEDSGLGWKDDKVEFKSPIGVPSKTRTSSQASPVVQSKKSDHDDLIVMDLDSNEEICPDMPTGVQDIVNAPFLLSDETDGNSSFLADAGLELTPPKHSRVRALFCGDCKENQDNLCKPREKSRRGLFRSPSAPRLTDSPYQRTYPSKRQEREGDRTPVQVKRRKSMVDCDRIEPKATPKLQRCQSETEEIIKNALNRCEQEPDLVGDYSKPFVLPLIKGRRPEFKCIARQTLSNLMSNQYDEVIENYTIIDCRYPYEYQGGHIEGALNLYTHETIIEEFIKSTKHQHQSSSNKRNILIFHCEFSSERAPKMYKFLRDQDRDANKECYPNLHYPEMYLLEGGYKEFFESHQEQCYPPTYKPMLHEDHHEDLKKFRTKSKSWAGERSSRVRSFKL